MSESNQVRLTYKSQLGDYGLTADHDRYKIYNKLGMYEDLGSVEYLTICVARIKEIEILNIYKEEE